MPARSGHGLSNSTAVGSLSHLRNFPCPQIRAHGAFPWLLATDGEVERLPLGAQKRSPLKCVAQILKPIKVMSLWIQPRQELNNNDVQCTSNYVKKKVQRIPFTNCVFAGCFFQLFDNSVNERKINEALNFMFLLSHGLPKKPGDIYSYMTRELSTLVAIVIVIRYVSLRIGITLCAYCRAKFWNIHQNVKQSFIFIWINRENSWNSCMSSINY